MPLHGYVDQISRSLVMGWAVNTDHPEGQVWVSIHANGVHRGTCLTQHRRPGVTLPGGGAAPENCEFRFVFDPPLSAFDEHRIEVTEIWSGDVLPNGRRVLPQPLLTDRKDSWTPVILTSTGRTATTLLMNEFARHPDMVVADRYPYETKHIAYYSAAFRALVADADRERSTDPDTMLAPQRRQIIGSNPYNEPGLFHIAAPAKLLQDFYEDTIPSAYATMFRDLIVKFYAILAGSQGKSTASLFCEKGDIDEAARRGARLFFGAVKEIVVIRDPRDLLCSAMAFWKLSANEALAMLQMSVARLARIIRHAGSDTLVVRYEDLLLDPSGSRLAMANFIGLDRPAQPNEETGTLFEKHGTSGAPAASIDRWRRELTPELIAACDATFGYFMRDFDYNPSNATAWPAHRVAGSRERAAGDLVAAAGRHAVVAMLADLAGEGEDGQPSRQILALTFGRGDNGTGFLRKGWSVPEDGYVWSAAAESYLCLPPIRQSGEYRLYIVGDPLTHATKLPVQRVTVLLDGLDIGTACVRNSSMIEVPVPSAMAATGQTVTLTLRLPDAARPADIGDSKDTRLLGFALRRIVLCHVAAAVPAAGRFSSDAPAPDTLAPDTLAPDALAPDTLASENFGNTAASDTSISKGNHPS
jgi:hypothetical protein